MWFSPTASINVLYSIQRVVLHPSAIHSTHLTLQDKGLNPAHRGWGLYLQYFCLTEQLNCQHLTSWRLLHQTYGESYNQHQLMIICFRGAFYCYNLLYNYSSSERSASDAQL